jgi:Uncharacterized membrane protein (DUF2298)
MLILKDLLLWALVCIHVIGTAFLFKRLFPRDSRWLAFVFPEIVFVLLCNFVEHHVALTQLRLLLPVTTAVSVGAMAWPRSPWRTMRLPALIFLAAFTFTLGLRLLRPNIADTLDGIADLSVIADFLHGQTLPAEGTWLPPVKMEAYYCLTHYGASVLTRLFGVEPGTGFNLSSALISAYILFLAGGIAWQLGRGKVWIAALCVFLTAASATGCAGYLWLTTTPLFPDNVIDPYSLNDLKPTPDNLLLRHLTPIDVYYFRHILMPPGYGSWVGYVHSTQAAQFLIGLNLLALVEALRRRRSNLPWPVLAVSPFLMIVSCTWGLPMSGFLVMAGTIAALRLKAAPRQPGPVLAFSAGLIVLLEPMLNYFLLAAPTVDFTWTTGYHTQWVEFFVQWWPIYLPGLLLAFRWRRLHPVTRIALLLTVLAFAGVETWTAGQRFDTTEKCWAIIFAAAWFIFLPEILRQRAWVFRVLALTLVVNSLLTLGFWTSYYARTVDKEDLAQIDGLGQYRTDRRKARILEVVSRLPGQTILPGEATWNASESGLLPLLSNTRSYLSTTNFDAFLFYPNGIGDAPRRQYGVDHLYAGTMADPLVFLRQHNIAALVIHPDDNLPASLVEKLKAQLAPYYTYEDANRRVPRDLDADVNPGNPAAGVFVYHPEITTLLGEPKP